MLTGEYYFYKIQGTELQYVWARKTTLNSFFTEIELETYSRARLLQPIEDLWSSSRKFILIIFLFVDRDFWQVPIQLKRCPVVLTNQKKKKKKKKKKKMFQTRQHIYKLTVIKIKENIAKQKKQKQNFTSISTLDESRDLMAISRFLLPTQHQGH